MAVDAAENDARRDLATIAVRGRGAVEVVPDLASITIGVDTFDPSLGQAQAANSRQAAAIIATLQERGVATRDLRTSRYDVRVRNPVDDHGRISPGIIGYDVSNHLSVTVRDPRRLGELLDAAVAAGANAVHWISFTVDSTAEAESRARDQAVKDGLRKARELADAAGVGLGRLVSIREGVDIEDSRRYEAKRSYMLMEEFTPIEAGTSTIAIDVQLVFEINAPGP